MSTTVVLAVALDPAQLAVQKSPWSTAGLIIVPVWSIRDAIEHFKAGDFDLVLLGHSLSAENRERFTSLIRKLGARTPVVCVGNASGDCNPFADVTFADEPATLHDGVLDFLSKYPAFPTPPAQALANAS
ncbi:MAG: hypothetical protein ABSG51_02450 [Terracidiphilus sp.]